MDELKRKKYLHKVLPYLLSFPSMVIIVLFLIIPLVYCLYCSFWRCDYMDFSKFVGLKNYIDVFSKEDYDVYYQVIEKYFKGSAF